MASIDNGAATPGYEPCARRGHALVAYKGCTYAVGGLDSADKTIDPTLIGVFDGSTLKWQQHRATGRHSLNLHWGELDNCTHAYVHMVANVFLKGSKLRAFHIFLSVIFIVHMMLSIGQGGGYNTISGDYRKRDFYASEEQQSNHC